MPLSAPAPSVLFWALDNFVTSFGSALGTCKRVSPDIRASLQLTTTFAISYLKDVHLRLKSSLVRLASKERPGQAWRAQRPVARVTVTLTHLMVMMAMMMMLMMMMAMMMMMGMINDGDDDDGDDHHNLRVTDNQNHLSFDDGPSFLWYRRAAQLLNSPSGYFIL